MSERKYILKGSLKGRPFIGSVEHINEREDKSAAIQIVGKNQLLRKGYRGYIFEELESEYESWLDENNISYVKGVEQLHTLLDHDIISVSPRGVINVQYRADSDDNVIFITPTCNSNCIMCPESEYNRKIKEKVEIENLKEYISLIPSDVEHLTITGGEPTLIKEELFEILRLCKYRFHNTKFLMLTNGRTFSIPSYARKFIGAAPKQLRVAIPIYSYKQNIHDEITRVPGSFSQTLIGIQNIGHKVEIEVRIVIMKDNYKDLPGIAQLIVSEIPYIHTVSFMGIELLGNAAINRDKVWIDYEETMRYVEEAAIILIENGIEANIYNYPLCSIPERLWSISKRSITDYKVRYKQECEECSVKSECGGFFFSTINYEKIKVKPVRGKV